MAKKTDKKILSLVDNDTLGLKCGEVAVVDADVAESLVNDGKADDNEKAIAEHEKASTSGDKE